MANPKQIKIAFVIDDSLDRNDGVQQYVKTLGDWTARQGHNVCYFAGETKTSSLPGGRVYSLARNINVTFNGNKLSIPLPATTKKIMKALATEKPDILHVQVPHSPFMAQKVINASYRTTAVLGTFHILPAGKLQVFASKLLKIYYGKNLQKFDQFVSVSQPAQEFAKQAFKIDSDVLPNVVDVSKFKNEAKANKKRIVFLGRLVERKGAQHLINACALVKQEIADFELIIAGDGPEKDELRRLADELGISQNTNFLGYINENDKPDLLGSARIACFPSLYGESFGIVLIEAMAAGSKVVLGGDNPGYNSVLGPRPELLFDPTDKNKLAKLLIKYLNDDESTQVIYEWQTEYVKQFDVATVGTELLKIYDKLVVNKSRK